jgi:hypothetical protein
MSRRRDDRGVSDVVSFVLVFALIISSVGLVTAFGLGTLQGIQQSERADAAERAFVVFTQGLDNVEDGTRPRFRGELDLSEATLAVTDGATVEVNVTGADYSRDVQLGALQYRTGDASFTYEGGGVFREDAGAPSVVVPPSFDCRDDHATVSLVELRADGSRSVGGGLAGVRVERETATVQYPESRGATTATGLTVETTNARWQSYFERSDDWTGAGPYTCSADRVFVRHTVLEVGLRV